MKTESKFESDDIIELSENGKLERIDNLLHSASDEATAGIGFDAIKRRAVENAALEKQRKHRRLLSYIAAAACMLLCFGVAGTSFIRSHKPWGEGDMSLNRHTSEPETDSNTHSPSAIPEIGSIDSNEIPKQYTKLLSIGVPTKGGSSQNEFKPDELFPDELPSYMERRIDINGTDGNVCSIAEGKDDTGSSKYFDCSLVESAPYDLNKGEVGSFETDDGCVFYWKLDDKRCMRVRFFGFDNEEASKLFAELTNDIMNKRSIQ